MGRCSDCCHIVAFDEVVEGPDGFLGVGEGYWCVRKIKPILDPDSHIGCEHFDPDLQQYTAPPRWIPPVQNTIMAIGVGEIPVRCSRCQLFDAPTCWRPRAECVANGSREIAHPDMPRICPDYSGSMRLREGRGRTYRPETTDSIVPGEKATAPTGAIRPFEVTVRGTLRIRVYARTPAGAARKATLKSDLGSTEVLKVREVRH